MVARSRRIMVLSHVYCLREGRKRKLRKRGEYEPDSQQESVSVVEGIEVNDHAEPEPRTPQSSETNIDDDEDDSIEVIDIKL